MSDIKIIKLFDPKLRFWREQLLRCFAVLLVFASACVSGQVDYAREGVLDKVSSGANKGQRLDYFRIGFNRSADVCLEGVKSLNYASRNALNDDSIGAGITLMDLPLYTEDYTEWLRYGPRDRPIEVSLVDVDNDDRNEAVYRLTDRDGDRRPFQSLFILELDDDQISSSALLEELSKRRRQEILGRIMPRSGGRPGVYENATPIRDSVEGATEGLDFSHVPLSFRQGQYVTVERILGRYYILAGSGGYVLDDVVVNVPIWLLNSGSGRELTPLCRFDLIK